MSKFVMAAAIAVALSSPALAGTIATQTTRAGADALIGPGATRVTFDGGPAGQVSTYTENGVTFSPNAGAALHIDTDYSGQYNTVGRSLHNQYAADSFGALRIDFAAPTSAFGFFYGASDNNWTLSAFTSTGTLVDSQVLPILKEANAGNFFGITGANISYATLVGPASDYIFVDDLTYAGRALGTPEPATWSMLVIGFGAVGAALRSRRKLALRTA